MSTSQAERTLQQTVHSLTQKLSSRRAMREPTYAEKIRNRIQRAQDFYRRAQRPASAGAW